eukprot:122517_1
MSFLSEKEVDYPLKQSLCIPYYIVFIILMVNGAIKYLFRHFVFIKPAEKVYHQKYLAERKTIRYKYDTLPLQHQNQYLLEYQSFIYLYLTKLFPDDISLLVIDYYIPLNAHSERTKTIKSLDDTPHKQLFQDFASLESWCAAHNHIKDMDGYPKRVGHRPNIKSYEYGDQLMWTITRVMNHHYVLKHNENEKHQNVAKFVQKYRAIRNAENIYTAVKSGTEFISTILMFIAFFEWNKTQESAFNQFNGFVLLFYYHPSFTFINLIQYSDTSKRGLGGHTATRWMPILPWILIFYLLNHLKLDPNLRSDAPVWFEKYLMISAAFNVFCVWIVWIITIPWVLVGGFSYISMMFFVYCGIALAVGILYCVVYGAVALVNKACGLRVDLDWDTIRPMYMWGLTFFYHSTSIMYITVVAGNGRSFSGTYCDPNQKHIDMNIDWRNWRVIWIVLSWLL